MYESSTVVSAGTPLGAVSSPPVSLEQVFALVRRTYEHCNAMGMVLTSFNVMPFEDGEWALTVHVAASEDITVKAKARVAHTSKEVLDLVMEKMNREGETAFTVTLPNGVTVNPLYAMVADVLDLHGPRDQAALR